MPLVDLVMQKRGESIMEATILKWHKQPGDAVKQDESILEIATDKVDSEVPSTTEGVLEEVLFKENDVVPVGSVIARARIGAAVGNSPAPAANPPASNTSAGNTPVARQEPLLRHEPIAAPTATTASVTNG